MEAIDEGKAYFTRLNRVFVDRVTNTLIALKSNDSARLTERIINFISEMMNWSLRYNKWFFRSTNRLHDCSTLIDAALIKSLL